MYMTFKREQEIKISENPNQTKKFEDFLKSENPTEDVLDEMPVLKISDEDGDAN